MGTDPTSDLAVIKLDGASGLTPATFADPGSVQVGDLAVAIGAPLGLSNTVTTGIVSALDRAVATGSDTDTTVIDAIQTDAAINPGNSGGALVDAAGEVIGINSAIATVAGSSGSQGSQSGNIGVGFAIPSDTAQRVAQQIIESGSATHALLGVGAQTASAEGSEVGQGAQVAQLTSGGPAADAGLQVGDVITAVGSREITTSTELTAAVRSAAPGDRVTLTVRRGDATSTVDVTLGTAPASRPAGRARAPRRGARALVVGWTGGRTPPADRCPGRPGPGPRPRADEAAGHRAVRGGCAGLPGLRAAGR